MRDVIISIFAFLGAVWLLIQLATYFWGKTIPVNPVYLWIIIVLAITFGLAVNSQRLTYCYSIKEKDIKIKIVIGDIFKQNGNVVLATNTTFDTTFKYDFISPKSLQGRFTVKHYDKIEHLDDDIRRALNDITPKEILTRTESKTNRYEIGTTIKLEHNGFKSYWVALADVNEKGKPQTNFENLQITLESLWNYLLQNGHLDTLVMPILGSGRSAVNETRERIIKEIIYSFVAFSNEKKITEELIICIYPEDFINKDIDITALDKFLEYNCTLRYENNTSKSSSVAL